MDISWSHTVASQSNRILLVWVYYWNDSRTISGVTYNSVALTKIATQINGGSAQRTMELWYLLAPDTGTHTVLVSGTGSAASKTGISVSLYNAEQSAPATPVTVGVNDTRSEVTLTGSTSHLFLDSLGHNQGSSFTTVPDSPQIEMTGVNQSTNHGQGASRIDGSASRVMGWTISPTLNCAQIGVKIASV